MKPRYSIRSILIFGTVVALALSLLAFSVVESGTREGDQVVWLHRVPHAVVDLICIPARNFEDASELAERFDTNQEQSNDSLVHSEMFNGHAKITVDQYHSYAENALGQRKYEQRYSHVVIWVRLKNGGNARKIVRLLPYHEEVVTNLSLTTK